MTASGYPLTRESGDPGWQELPDWADAVADDGCEPSPGRDDRRHQQRMANIAIGDGTDTVPLARIYTLPEMLEQFVFIKDGSQVAPMDRPQSVLGLADFRNAVAASKHWVEVDGKNKALPATKVWLESPDRKEAEAITFRAGGPRMTTEPGSGKGALNLWAGFDRSEAPGDWAARSKPFVDHVEWLWGADAPAFLDWLAHIEQHPGVLPHFGWVHISREHGKGRNWISSMLSRVWSGYVAASLDLIPLLEGSFNGRISRKLLAIVDEINEGGNASYKHAQKLRQLVTEEQRDINPKYSRQRVEYNSCRWLIYSNHTGALPLTEDDRRFYVVAHDGPPRDVEYYAKLYGLLGDPQFIAAVATFLQARDVRQFKPGARPPMNQAKAELIGFSQSEDDVTAKAIAQHWPVDLIIGREVEKLFGEGGATKAPVRHAMERAGIRKLAKRVRYFEHVQHVYVVRNFDRWANVDADAARSEIRRKTDDEKTNSLDPDD